MTATVVVAGVLALVTAVGAAAGVWVARKLGEWLKVAAAYLGEFAGLPASLRAVLDLLHELLGKYDGLDERVRVIEGKMS